MKTENKNQTDLDKITAVVKGTRTLFIEVEIPHTIRLSKDDYFFKDLWRCDFNCGNGVWNAELDCIKNQLPSQEKDLAVAKEFINAGKISDFHCSPNFDPKSYDWESKNND